MGATKPRQRYRGTELKPAANRNAEPGSPHSPAARSRSLDRPTQNRAELRPPQVQAELPRDHYAALHDFAPVGYLTLDRSGLVTAINPRGAQILGRTRDRLVGWPLMSAICEPDRRKFVNHLRLCPGQNGCVTTELRLADGAARWIELLSLATPVELLESPKRALIYKCVLIDVTIRKKAEQALQASEERFRMMADFAPVLIWIADADRQFSYLNKRWLDFTGRTLAEELGDGWVTGVHVEDVARCLQIYSSSFDARKGFKMEYRFRRFDGVYRWVLASGLPNSGPNQEFRGFIGSCVDITERKEMETALEAVGRLPRENPSPVMRLDYGRIISFANPAAHPVITEWGTALGDEVPASVSRTAVRALSRNERQSRDLAVGDREFQVVFAPFREAGHVNLYFSDITGRKTAERALRKAHRELENRVNQRTLELARANAGLEKQIAARKLADSALRESEERLSLMIESTRDYAIVMLDPEGRVASWNLGAQLINGYRAREIQDRHFSCFYPPADVRTRKPQRLLELAQKRGRAEDEGWRIRKNGSRFWASVVITAVRDKSGRLRGYAKVTRDITERRQVQESLRISERNLTDFFNESPLGLFWIGSRGKILRINRAGKELLGLPPRDCGRHRIEEFLAERKPAADILKRLSRQDEVQNYRVRLLRRDHSIRHVLVDANGVWECGRLHYSRWFARDITRRLELEREVLLVAERERQRIGHELHDDLCQQLTGIEFLSQTLAGQLARVSEDNATRAREIARMARMAINHTRELAHGLSPVQLETMGLTGALEELAARTRRLFKVNCRFRSNARAWNHDAALGIHLYRIAQEAVSNALKHGHAKRVDIGLVRNKYRLVLAVSDNGIGLPLKPRKTKGTGLHVMQYRAGAINGNVVVRRNLKGGTTVACTISDVFNHRNQKPTS